MINLNNFTQTVCKMYPNIAYMVDDIAYDADSNEVAYDLALVQAEINANAYKAKRAAEYPPMTDYLDGIVKGDNAQVQAYIDACNAVKNKYPKGAPQ
jgi:hypothetical protein